VLEHSPEKKPQQRSRRHLARRDDLFPAGDLVSMRIIRVRTYVASERECRRRPLCLSAAKQIVENLCLTF